MISRGRIILSHILVYILVSMWGVVLELIMKTTFHHTWERFERQIIEIMVILGIIVLFLLVKQLINWQRLYGKIYPIFKKEGMSQHFFQVAEEYGETIEHVKISTTYWLNLLCYYQTMNQDDKALKAFTKVDAAYIHSIKNSKVKWKQTLVKVFFNNGLSVCLKTGNFDDAKRLYRDGFPFLQNYTKKDIAVMDTLAAYHFLMEEYEEAAKLYEKLLATGRLPLDMVKTATERVTYAKEQSVEQPH